MKIEVEYIDYDKVKELRVQREGHDLYFFSPKLSTMAPLRLIEGGEAIVPLMSLYLEKMLADIATLANHMQSDYGDRVIDDLVLKVFIDTRQHIGAVVGWVKQANEEIQYATIIPVPNYGGCKYGSEV